MKKTLLLMLLLLVGCQQSANTVVSTVTLPPVATQVPETTAPPTSLPEAAYPAPVPVPTSDPALIPSPVSPETSYPSPTFGPSPTMIPTPTTAPTLTSVEKKEIVMEKWKSCQTEWLEKARAFPAAAELAGLVFRTEDALWKIDRDGKSALLSCMPRSRLSPSAMRISFQYDNEFWFYDRPTGTIQQISDDPQSTPYFHSWSPEERYVIFNKLLTDGRPSEIWVMDTISEERHQVTNSPQFAKFRLSVWPKNPEWVVFNAFIPEIPPGEGVNGAVVLAKMDGSVETILSEDSSYTYRSDDSTLWYRTPDGLMVLQAPEEEPKPFGEDMYNLGNWKLRGGSFFEWSPDGKQVAMPAVARNQAGEYTGLAVFTPATKTAEFLHPFTPIGFGGSPILFSWSPDNLHLAVEVRDENPQKSGFWLLTADGSKEINLSNNYCSLWSPEGDRLLCRQITDHQYWIYHVDTGDQTFVKLHEIVNQFPDAGLLWWDKVSEP